MEQHAIPRQITSFEFKLIGFMTLKQFLYIVIFAPLGYIVYMLFPLPLLNILVGFGVGILGVVLAFVPINDRPLDVWLKNLWRRLNSPTQFFFHKHNPPITIFQNLYFVDDPHRVFAHVESQKMLAAYLTATQHKIVADQKKQQINHIIQTPTQSLRVAVPTKKAVAIAGQDPNPPPLTLSSVAQPVVPLQAGGMNAPFFMGLVKNNKQLPLSGILIYVKDLANKPVRLLKSNPHGVFATYNPLPPNEYIFEMKDPKSLYFFDTMKVRVESTNSRPFEFVSKEML